MEYNEEKEIAEFSSSRVAGIEYRDHTTPETIERKFDPLKLYRFFCVAEGIATLSRDPSTKVGCLIFGPGYEIRSSGWNGAPRGCRADEDERYKVRSEKLWWVAHAELNAIVNAARTGTPLERCALMATAMPCMGCAKAIVQAGITEVMCPEPDEAFAERWKDDIARTKELFRECGIRLITFKEVGE